MSADEDTELRDLVAQTLETNGVFGKIRAELRASVFLTLEEQESIQTKTPFLNQELKRFLGTKQGRAVAGLVLEFLEHFNLECTQSVFEPESGVKASYEGRESLARELNIIEDDGPSKAPLLGDVLDKLQQEKLGRPSSDTYVNKTASDQWNIPEDLLPKQIEDARKKFEYYDKDSNGIIDKEELRNLFADIFPSFHRVEIDACLIRRRQILQGQNKYQAALANFVKQKTNMLERYVNDEFRAVDKDFSNSIDFDEFLGMYRRLFVLCRSVVSGDISDIIPGPPKRPGDSISSIHSLDKSSDNVGRNGGGGFRWDEPVASSKGSVHNQIVHDPLGSDVDEDPFFDDPLPPSANNPGLRAISDQDRGDRSTELNGEVERGKGGGSMLGDLPPLTSNKPDNTRTTQLTMTESSKEKNGRGVRALDKRMADMDLSDMGGDFEIEYEDDFLSTQSLSQKSPRTISKSEHKSQNENGSIAEEIEEEIDNVNSDADDLLRSQNSAFEDLTTDRTISQYDAGFDYAEDIQLP